MPGSEDRADIDEMMSIRRKIHYAAIDKNTFKLQGIGKCQYS